MKYGRLDAYRVSDLDEDQSQMLGAFFAEVDERLQIPIPTGNDSVPGPTNFILIDPKVGKAMTRLGGELNAVDRMPARPARARHTCDGSRVALRDGMGRTHPPGPGDRAYRGRDQCGSPW